MATADVARAAQPRRRADQSRIRRGAERRLAAARDAVERQAGTNRALGLGRVPLLAARIVRALDGAGLRLAPDVAATEDIDLLFDARASIVLQAGEDLTERSLMGLLRRVDRSFELGR